MKKTLLTALLALAGLTGSVHAQVAAAYGDLILGFRATSGTGQNVNLEVDLGSITLYSSATSTITISKLAAADISSIYGPNWATRTDLYWGIVGTTSRTATGPGGQPVDTLWATKPEATAGTQNTIPWARGSASAQSVGAAAIEPLFINAPGSLNGHVVTTNSTNSAAINATLSGSYSNQDVVVQAGESFAYFNPTVDNTTNFGSVSYRVSDLYELRPGSGNGTYLGSFGLTAAGTLTFSPTAAYFTGTVGNETFTTQPASATVVSGSTVVFTAAASGTPTPTYQWYLNSVAISGATNARLVIPAADGTKAGVYAVVATNSTGSATSNSANLTISPATNNPGRLINLSVLSNISGSLAMGFVTGGSGTSGQQNLLIRATGPALGIAPFSIAGVMTDPTLKVTQQSNSNTVAQNSGWGTPSTNVAIVQTADNATGAFALTNTASLDSALVANLPSVTGGYSATVASATHGTGYSLAEVYDDTATYTATTPRLVNLSCLTQLPASGGINVGFVIGGTTAKTVLIRASGPTLAAAPFNIPGSMPDPQLTVAPLSSSTTVLATNAGWGGDTALSSTATAVGAFALTSLTSKDSATVITLQPNVPYTVAVSSVTGAGGWVLVEIYEVP